MQMKQVMTVCALGMLMALSYVSAAAAQDGAPPAPQGIDVSVKGGAGRQLVSVAVAPIQAAAGAEDAKKRLEAVIARDLELAGFFKVIASDALFFDASAEGMDAGKINFENWFNVKAQGLVKGAVRVEGGKIVADLRLFIVDRKEQAKLTFTASPSDPAEIEAVGHAFANAVVAYYTGEAGVFGEWVAFIKKDKAGRKQVYAQRVGETSERQITKNDSINLLPRWTGGKLYYTSYQDQNPDLWVWDGSNHRKVSSQRGMNSGASACGGKLALTMSKGGENADVYTVDPQTGKETGRLTDHWGIDTSPSFSPDCKKIAFVSGRSGSPQIFVMNADGSDQRRLTFKGTYNTSPSWSPKGDKIVFQARDERGNYDIFLVDLQGNIERLTQNQGSNEDPAFSKDGRYIVFISDRKGGKQVWMSTADGDYQRALTSGGAHSTPTWSR